MISEEAREKSWLDGLFGICDPCSTIGICDPCSTKQTVVMLPVVPHVDTETARSTWRSSLSPSRPPAGEVQQAGRESDDGTGSFREEAPGHRFAPRAINPSGASCIATRQELHELHELQPVRSFLDRGFPTQPDTTTFFFFFTLVTGPRRSLSVKLSDTRVYEPQIRARAPFTNGKTRDTALATQPGKASHPGDNPGANLKSPWRQPRGKS